MTAEMDIRAALPAISIPTLVIHRADDRIIPVENGRYVAEHIPNAKYAELDGEDHLWWFGDQEALVGEVEEFLTGSRERGSGRRALMTVLFTDVVDSTKRMSELGDRRWRDLIAAHDREVRAQLERFRGREVNTMGDGFLATFDGPARAIRSACAVVERSSELGLSVRAGLHTGECELVGDGVSGIAVNIGARVGALAEGDEVLVSSTVRDLVIGSGIEFADRGAHALKGVPGEWRVFAVTNA
jgi:class 3 adenylate cyclase